MMRWVGGKRQYRIVAESYVSFRFVKAVMFRRVMFCYGMLSKGLAALEGKVKSCCDVLCLCFARIGSNVSAVMGAFRWASVWSRQYRSG